MPVRVLELKDIDVSGALTEALTSALSHEGQAGADWPRRLTELYTNIRLTEVKVLRGKFLGPAQVLGGAGVGAGERIENDELRMKKDESWHAWRAVRWAHGTLGG